MAGVESQTTNRTVHSVRPPFVIKKPQYTLAGVWSLAAV